MKGETSVKTNNTKRLLSMILALIMVVGLFPMSVMASAEKPFYLVKAVDGTTVTLVAEDGSVQTITSASAPTVNKS